MKKYFLLWSWLFFFCWWLAACGTGVAGTDDSGVKTTTKAPKKGEPVSLTIATFNTHQFFDTKCDSGSCNGSNYEVQLSAGEYKNKLDTVASGIKKFQADIVMVQEIETEAVMGDLFKKLSPNFTGYAFAEQGLTASVDCGLFYNGTKLAILQHKDLDDKSVETPYFSRPLLEVRLAFHDENIADEEPEVIVFSAHFRSKAGTDDPARRKAEAATARRIILDRAEKYPEALIVLGGDLNDTPDSQTLKTMTADGRILRVASDVAADKQNTYYYQKKYMALDHLLMAAEAGGQYEAQSAAAVKGDSYNGGYAGSDHAALKADFVVE